MKTIALLIIAAFGVSAAPFTNGSFEDGPNPGGGFLTYGVGVTPITGWEVVSGTIDYIGSLWQHSDGIRSLDLDGTPGAAKIQQTFDTVTGQQYRVLFDLSGNSAGFPIVKRLRVAAGGDSADYEFDITGLNFGNMGWVTEEFLFTATGDSTTLSFESLTTGTCCWGPALDNVRVSTVDVNPIPEPSTVALALAGLAALALRRR